MANAKKCDRCGNFYQEVEPNTIDQVANAISNLVASIATHAYVEKQIRVIENFLDLCPSCSKSLKRWVKCVEKSNQLIQERGDDGNDDST